MKVKLVDSKTGSNIISEKDEYICNFSKFDLQSRLGTTEEVSKQDLVKFLSQQTLDWTQNEKDRIERICEEIEDVYLKYINLLPEEILFIKTTGLDEGNAAYTRKNCIYIPISMIIWPYNELKELIAHELFHIVSTQNPEFRNDLYIKLGFTPCSELKIPENYKQLYVTNPDTINKNCYMEFQDSNGTHKATPFLYSEQQYRGGYFFRYFRFTFLMIQLKDNISLPIFENGHPKFINAPKSLYDLCEEIDPYNNQHRLHPEEILAYYWSLLAIPESELEYEKRNFLLKIRNYLNNNKNKIF
ncbi:MAG: hypothetical protein ACFE8J_16175 [Candidatus Heimdallarchaeota archaeon]